MPDSIGKSIRKKCVVTVQPTISGALTAVTVGLLGTVADSVSDFLGRSFLLELVSSDLDCDCHSNLSAVRFKLKLKHLKHNVNDWRHTINTIETSEAMDICSKIDEIDLRA
nr:linoleate 13S-lipoxygenase 2-1, chloroplastic-like [Tanacetum cinerariifolium]